MKTLDSTIGRTFLMTRPENNAAQQGSSDPSSSGVVSSGGVGGSSGSGGVSSSGGVGVGSDKSMTSSDMINSQVSSVSSGVGGSGGGGSGGIGVGVSGVGVNSSSSSHRGMVGTGGVVDPSAQKTDDSNYLNTSGGSTSFVMTQMSKDLIFTSENRARLGLLKTCIALIPRMMPMFKGWLFEFLPI